VQVGKHLGANGKAKTYEAIYATRNRMNRTVWFALLLLCILLFLLFGCFEAGIPSAIRADGMLPSFPDGDGWYGGDGAYSIIWRPARPVAFWRYLRFGSGGQTEIAWV